MTATRTGRYIAIEGPIGAGKTSLTRLLADLLSAEPFYEPVSENPFLEAFYEDRACNALPVQLAFLLARLRQQGHIASLLAEGRSVVCDYSPAKDEIFAELTLEPAQLALYRELRSLLPGETPPPDLVVYLEVGVDVLLRRVRQRGDPRERRITPDYLRRVADAYRARFFNYDRGPLLVVDCSQIDFVERDADLQDLAEEIGRMERGTRHYILRRR